jgi:hypothetical protein
MKKSLVIIFIFSFLQSSSQSVFGYWYGFANVKTKSSANNYLVELILNPEKGYVSGILNYYFKNNYRSLKVKGNYDPKTRQLRLYEIPVTYHGSLSTLEVDCIMNMKARLRVAKAGSNLLGSFVSLPQYKYTCADISFNLKMSAGISKKDSVMLAMQNFKETKQLWTPAYSDTLMSMNIIPRKLINYVIEKEMVWRKNEITREIEVESDSLKIDFYDNGEVDGDSISVFFNRQLIAYHQKLSTSSIHFEIALDSFKKTNEIIMFAENLGAIAPNTALMIIDDGKNRFTIRMASNLDKNATIQIKRKPPLPRRRGLP